RSRNPTYTEAARRYVGARNACGDHPDRAYRQGTRADIAVHGARHGGGVFDRREDRSHASGTHHRRRQPGVGSRRRRGAARVSGTVGMGALLELDKVHAAYGLSRVLFGVSLEVQEGECVCLLGRNGVGKTTTMRTVMGLTPSSAGRIRFKSRDITGWPPHRIARAGIGLVPEDRRIFAELTVWENLDVGLRAAARRGRWTIDGVLELF